MITILQKNVSYATCLTPTHCIYIYIYLYVVEAFTDHELLANVSQGDFTSPSTSRLLTVKLQELLDIFEYLYSPGS